MAVKRYNGTSWDTVAGKGEQGTSSSITTWVKTASGGETSLTGSSDSSTTLAYTPGQEQLFINGVLQVRDSDYTATNGTSITGISALIAGDVATVTTVNAFSVTGAVPLSTVTANGDLIVGTSSGAVGRLGIGGTGTLLTVAGGVPTWAAAPASGKILQVVSATTTSSVTVNSSSYTDSNLTATITPQFSTSKILVMLSQTLTVSKASVTSILGGVQLLRNSTSIYNLSNQVPRIGGASGTLELGVSTPIIYLDSPATTSATTYKTQIKTLDPTHTIYANLGISSIILMEVGA